MTARTAWRMDDACELRAGYRDRSATELHADLIAGCRTLGQLSDGWNAVGYVPTGDLPDVDRIVSGLHSNLIALRAQEIADAA